MQHKFHNKTDQALIQILDSPDIYSPHIQLIVQEIIESRGLNSQERSKLAAKVYRKKIKQLLEESTFSFEDWELPTSQLLNPSEQETIFHEELEEYTINRELLNTGMTISSLGESPNIFPEVKKKSQFLDQVRQYNREQEASSFLVSRTNEIREDNTSLNQYIRIAKITLMIVLVYLMVIYYLLFH